MGSAHFGFEDDRELSKARLLDFQWLITSAIEQARLDPKIHDTHPRDLPRRRLHQFRQLAEGQAGPRPRPRSSRSATRRRDEEADDGRVPGVELQEPVA